MSTIHKTRGPMPPPPPSRRRPSFPLQTRLPNRWNSTNPSPATKGKQVNPPSHPPTPPQFIKGLPGRWLHSSRSVSQVSHHNHSLDNHRKEFVKDLKIHLNQSEKSTDRRIESNNHQEPRELDELELRIPQNQNQNENQNLSQISDPKYIEINKELLSLGEQLRRMKQQRRNEMQTIKTVMQSQSQSRSSTPHKVDSAAQTEVQSISPSEERGKRWYSTQTDHVDHHRNYRVIESTEIKSNDSNRNKSKLSKHQNNNNYHHQNDRRSGDVALSQSGPWSPDSQLQYESHESPHRYGHRHRNGHENGHSRSRRGFRKRYSDSPSPSPPPPPEMDRMYRDFDATISRDLSSGSMPYHRHHHYNYSVRGERTLSQTSSDASGHSDFKSSLDTAISNPYTLLSESPTISRESHVSPSSTTLTTSSEGTDYHPKGWTHFFRNSIPKWNRNKSEDDDDDDDDDSDRSENDKSESRSRSKHRSRSKPSNVKKKKKKRSKREHPPKSKSRSEREWKLNQESRSRKKSKSRKASQRRPRSGEKSEIPRFSEMKMQRVFKELDRDQSGVLSEAEFQKSLRSLHIARMADKMRKRFRKMDRDKSGYLDYSEFRQCLLGLHQSKSLKLTRLLWIFKNVQRQKGLSYKAFKRACKLIGFAENENLQRHFKYGTQSDTEHMNFLQFAKVVTGTKPTKHAVKQATKELKTYKKMHDKKA